MSFSASHQVPSQCMPLMTSIQNWSELYKQAHPQLADMMKIHAENRCKHTKKKKNHQTKQFFFSTKFRKIVLKEKSDIYKRKHQNEN